MRINGVDLPKSLIEAQQNGELLIFAGAGVSIPSPSNYPDFVGLATQVAAGVISRDGDDEPIDRFLGRLAHRKVDVHSRVKELLTDPKSIPNSLHFDLLHLFPSASKVRIVTTNFDLHFSTAAREVFPNENVETFAAPALPVGSDFESIVYLHGSVANPAERLVLTDSDFGRAYLTEGWARRFLQQLFAKYFTLFIGFRHRDPVLSYLARALPPEAGIQRRFALTKRDDTQWWDYLGVASVEYDEANQHSQLLGFVSKWSAIASSGAIQRQERIKSIVERPLAIRETKVSAVPLNDDDLDFVENALSDISGVRAFTQFAKDLDWLYWIEKQSAFKRLFQTGITYTDLDRHLASWYAEDFVCKQPDAALAVLRRNGGRVTPVLWSAIASSFHANKVGPNGTEKVGPSVLNKWVPILIKYPNPISGSDLLEYTLARSIYPDYATCALLLFEYLTRPDVILQDHFWRDPEHPDKEETDIELTTEGDDPWIPSVWKKFFEPNLSFFVHKLIWIVTSHLQQAHLLLDAYGKIHEDWDPLSSRRGQIESTSQGSPRKAIGILIDIARDILLWSIENENATAEFLIDAWFASEVRILKRLAVFGVSRTSHWKDDQKIGWLLQKSLIYSRGFKHEVFSVLEESYEGASLAMREKVLTVAVLGHTEESKAYEQFNLLLWLSKNAPNCTKTQAAFADIQRKHPQFSVPEHPDMDGWVGPVTTVTWQSPLSTEKVLSQTPEDFLGYFNAYEPTPDEILRGGTEGLMQQVTARVVKDFPWGMELASLIAERGLEGSKIWLAVIDGWTASVTGKQWSEILLFLAKNEKLLSNALYGLSNLLKDGMQKPDRAIPPEEFEAAFGLGVKLWTAIVQSSGASESEKEDWLFVAINHPAGFVSEFFVHALAEERKVTNSASSALPSRYKDVFTGIVLGDSYAAELGRVILASQLLFLFAVDEKWTVEFLLPLFRWRKDPHTSIQAWHGFLAWGKWNESLLVFLLPCYEEAFKALHDSFGDFRNQFCSHLAGIALLSSVNPVEHGWLNRFLSTVHAEERGLWADAVGQVLKQTTDSSKTGIWNRWMKRYWHDRIQGVPVPLSASEVGSMVHWAVSLEPVFDEVVEMISRSPSPELEYGHIYYELAHSTLGSQHPTASAELLLTLLRSENRAFWSCDDVEKVLRDIASTKPSDKRTLLLVRDQLVKLGCGGGAE